MSCRDIARSIGVVFAKLIELDSWNSNGLRFFQSMEGFRAEMEALKKTGPDFTSWDLNHLQLAIKAAGVTLWSWNVDSDLLNLGNL